MYIFTIFHHHHATLVFSSLSFVCVAVCVTYDIDWAQSMERPSEASRMNERYSTQVETVSQLTMWCVISLASNRKKNRKLLHFFLYITSLPRFGFCYIYSAAVALSTFKLDIIYFSLFIIILFYQKTNQNIPGPCSRTFFFSLFFYFFLFLFFAPSFQ